MSDERWLVTGALGCIGAWTAITLVREGRRRGRVRPRRRRPPPPADRRRRRRSPRSRSPAATSPTSGRSSASLAEHEITHVVHLAALQVPFVPREPRARRPGERDRHGQRLRGGEAARAGERRSPTRARPPSTTAAARSRRARSTASSSWRTRAPPRVYAAEHGVASVGLRPFTVYGPGRDQGMTAGPTLAIAAAVRGEPYRIAFGGRTQLHYAARRRPRLRPGGALGAGRRADVLHRRAGDVDRGLRRTGRPGGPRRRDLVSTTRRCPFPDQLPEPWFDAPLTPLEEGVRETAATLRSVV